MTVEIVAAAGVDFGRGTVINGVQCGVRCGDLANSAKIHCRCHDPRPLPVIGGTEWYWYRNILPSLCSDWN